MVTSNARRGLDPDPGYGRDPYEDGDEDERPRRGRASGRPAPSVGAFGRMFRVVRFLVFILPLSLLLIGSFLVDCRDRSGRGFLPEIVRSSACARQDVMGHLSNLEETMRTVSKAIR